MEGFLPILDAAALPGRVLAIAPHSDDEILGCGGMLARHADRGDAVRVVHVSDGAGLDADRAVTEERAAEARAALECLDVGDVVDLGLADGRLDSEGGLATVLADEVARFGPGLVYAPSPWEAHPDHRAVFAGLAAGLWEGDLAATPCHLYGVNNPVWATVLYDITAQTTAKNEALDRFETQAALQLAWRCEWVDRARAVNVDMPGIERLEAFLACRLGDLAGLASRHGEFHAWLGDLQP